MAVGSLLQTYLSRFGVSMEGMSGETIGFAAALDAVARVDPGIAQAIFGELVQRELRESCGLVGDGELAERQVRGGGAWSSSVCGLRQRRRHRVAHRRTCLRVVRRRSRVRAAA